MVGYVGLAFATSVCGTLAGAESGQVERGQTRSDERWKEGMVRRLGSNDPDVPAHLAEGIVRRPKMRAWAFNKLLSLGPSGQAALTALGNEAVDLALQTESGFLAPEQFDARAVMKALGPSASERLFVLIESPDADPSLQQKAMYVLTQLQDRRNVDKLAQVAQTHPNPWVRVQAAQGVSWVEPRKGTPLLIPLLRDRTFGWVAADGLADIMVRVDDDGALDALTVWLKNPGNPRGERWLVAKKLTSSGRPGPMEIARKFGPTGPQGEGNPESPFGARLAAAIGGVSLLSLFALGRRGDLSVWQRLVVVSAGVIGSYVGAAFLLAYWIAWSSGAFMSSGAIHGLQAMELVIVALMCVAPTAAVWFVRWVTGWRRASALMVGVGSGLGMLAAILIHERVYWYVLERSPFDSSLTLSVTCALALVASYWPRGLIFAE